MTSFEGLQQMCKDLEKYDVNYRVEPYSKTLIKLTDGIKSMYGTSFQLYSHLVRVGRYLYNEAKKKCIES
jgi:hypothetical protein